MEVKLFSGDIQILRPIAESWRENARTNEFGIITGERFLTELSNMASGENSDLIVLYDGETPVGYIGLRYFDSPLGDQRIAEEHFFYVMPENRGMSSMRLLKNAEFLAKLKRCSHIILNASNLASDLHDKLCGFYVKLGFKKFETSFIKKFSHEDSKEIL